MTFVARRSCRALRRSARMMISAIATPVLRAAYSVARYRRRDYEGTSSTLGTAVALPMQADDAAGEPGGFALYSSGTLEKGGRRHAARRTHGHHCAARVASGEFKQRLSDIADT